MAKKELKKKTKLIFKTSNGGRWVITESSNNKNRRFTVSLRGRNGVKIGSDNGFNTMASVMKHIRAVMNTCQLVPVKAAKGGTVGSLSINAYQYTKSV